MVAAEHPADPTTIGLPRTFGQFDSKTSRELGVDQAVANEVLKVLGSYDMMHEISASYFNSVYHRMPILSKIRFRERLQRLSPETGADFAALCLCIFLIQQSPRSQTESMQSSLYISTKSVISMLEATSYQSLEVIQCRLLVSFYEMGHGIYPAAFVSIAACAKLARAISLNRSATHVGQNYLEMIVAEERRRTWWAVLNLERLVSLFHTE
jgi:hypothetical protein